MRKWRTYYSPCPFRHHWRCQRNLFTIVRNKCITTVCWVRIFLLEDTPNASKLSLNSTFTILKEGSEDRGGLEEMSFWTYIIILFISTTVLTSRLCFVMSLLDPHKYLTINKQRFELTLAQALTLSRSRYTVSVEGSSSMIFLIIFSYSANMSMSTASLFL